MTLADQIRANELKDFHLSDLPWDIDANELIQVLRGGSTSLESVRLDGGFLMSFRNEERVELLEAIGGLVNICEVHLADALLTVEGITKLLLKAKTLKSFKLQNLVLQGVQEHFDACEGAFHKQTSLKEFEMINCTTAVADIDLEVMQKAGEKKGGCNHLDENKRTGLLKRTNSASAA
jgi:hypothetical protein